MLSYFQQISAIYYKAEQTMVTIFHQGSLNSMAYTRASMNQVKKPFWKKRKFILCLPAEWINQIKIILPAKMNRKAILAYLELNQMQLFGEESNKLALDFYTVPYEHEKEIIIHYLNKKNVEDILNQLSIERNKIIAIESEYQSVYRLLQTFIQQQGVSVLVYISSKKIALIMGSRKVCYFSNVSIFIEENFIDELKDFVNNALLECQRAMPSLIINYYYLIEDQAMQCQCFLESDYNFKDASSLLQANFYSSNKVDWLGLGVLLRHKQCKI